MIAASDAATCCDVGKSCEMASGPRREGEPATTRRMSTISLRNVHFSWGGPQLLDGVSLEIGTGERIGLVGRNGAGKSTLMGVVEGRVAPDDGSVVAAPETRVTKLVQDVPQTLAGSVESIVKDGLAADATAADWESQTIVDKVISRLGLDPTAEFSTLSSGMKRRVLLAQALAGEPDVLLLDEPTNHLDITSIAWLERFLKGYDGTVMFVTHDRQFLQALADRIVEVDRGRLFDWTCDYATFLKRKEDQLAAEEQQNKLFDKKLAEEEVWIRQGIKARRTRNEGRVRALKKLREQRSQRREQTGTASLAVAEAEKSGRLVLEAKKVSYAIGERTLVDHFSTLITRGDKVGIIGPNGAGKSTLLKLLLGHLEPSSGTVRRGTNLKIAYFDQLREQIDEDQTVAENVGEGSDSVTIDGNTKHIYGYLQDFLFTPEQARQPARALSGGERNRLLLAKLFKNAANLLVLDEPTNDLDLETLELLEELLVNFAGTVLLVSHDRAFLNNVVTATFAVEGDGQVREYAGGYDDYERQRAAADVPTATTKPAEQPKARGSRSSKKLSYREQKELDELPARLEELEAAQEAMQAAMADPDYFKQSPEKLAEDGTRMKELADELATAYERWETLEAAS